MSGSNQLEQARQDAEQWLGTQTGAHTVYIGERESGGQITGGPAIVFLVGEKMTPQELSVRHVQPLPAQIDGVPVDVQQSPQPRPLLLRTDVPQPPEVLNPHFSKGFRAHAGDVHPQAGPRECWDAPIPGGVQIAPTRPNVMQPMPWVGTMGSAIAWTEGGKQFFGALTNAHVSGLKVDRNTRILQPGGTGSNAWIGVVHYVHPIRMGSTGTNEVDMALLDTFRNDGPYAGPEGKGTHLVAPRFFSGAPLNPSPVVAAIGMEVQKEGRTTGHTQGRVVGIGATSLVNYGADGTGRFVNQVVLRGADGGDMSAGGDSGSLIRDLQNRPVALLFAGGGGTTLANPIQSVISKSSVGGRVVRFYGPSN